MCWKYICILSAESCLLRFFWHIRGHSDIPDYCRKYTNHRIKITKYRWINMHHLHAQFMRSCYREHPRVELLKCLLPSHKKHIEHWKQGLELRPSFYPLNSLQQKFWPLDETYRWIICITVFQVIGLLWRELEHQLCSFESITVGLRSSMHSKWLHCLLLGQR